MNEPEFPSKRDDGSFTVSARFSLPNYGSQKLVEDCVAEWFDKKVLDEQIDLATDLSANPRVVAIARDRVEIVFEGQPGTAHPASVHSKNT